MALSGANALAQDTAKSLGRHLIGSYNNLRVVDGDLLGTEITLLPFGVSRAKVVIKIASGSLSEIYVADISHSKNGSMTFAIPCPDCSAGALAKGTITPKPGGVQLRVEYPKLYAADPGFVSDEFLRKGPSYWDQIM